METILHKCTVLSDKTYLLGSTLIPPSVWHTSRRYIVKVLFAAILDSFNGKIAITLVFTNKSHVESSIKL